ncbi:protein of unknown function [Candidatus Nitrosocosmicus franklandus]|uniref:Uncharacterized protein n=1 Tax=Candidatus Nitrosocosmicus franklandianus TaxID=1798806 RepID=A0A484IJ15_9ARCH|nr:protein of unknown function [Candidatus Nitrosocosmicus franklandus]
MDVNRAGGIMTIVTNIVPVPDNMPLDTKWVGQKAPANREQTIIHYSLPIFFRSSDLR